MKKQTLLLTRPEASAYRFLARMDANSLVGVRVIVAPLIEIVPFGPIPDFERYSGAIFTSRNGATFAPKGEGRSAYCVGQATAEKATACGWKVCLTAQNAETLVAALLKADTGPLLHLCGRHRRGQIAERLTAQGKEIGVHVLYDQHLLPLTQEAQSALSGEDRVVVPLFSPRTAAQFTSQAGDQPHVTALAMSEAVAKALGNVHFNEVLIAKAPTADEMVIGAEKLLRCSGLS